MDKISELLKPRVIVENNYPGSPFKHHEIICEPSAVQTEWAKEFTVNFRFLDWWEYRNADKMPEYLKYATQPYSIKPFVVYPAKFIKEESGWTVEVDKHIIPHGNYLKDKLPATLDEYNEYKK